jgi:hypothetical protein
VLLHLLHLEEELSDIIKMLMRGKKKCRKCKTITNKLKENQISAKSKASHWKKAFASTGTEDVSVSCEELLVSAAIWQFDSGYDFDNHRRRHENTMVRLHLAAEREDKYALELVGEYERSAEKGMRQSLIVMCGRKDHTEQQAVTWAEKAHQVGWSF